MTRRRLVVLALSILIGTALAAENATNSSDADLALKVLAVSELQDANHLPSEKVVSGIVKEAPAAELANGDGDISTIGPCRLDIDALCFEAPPGEGRLATCILKRLKNEEKGNVTGRRVSAQCKRDVSAFFADRAKNVNKNLQLASACKQNIAKFCSDMPDKGEAGAVLACLRRHRKKLQPTCKALVTKAMIAASNDLRADPALFKACGKEAERLCDDVPAGEGRVQACLRDKAREVSIECQEELFRQEVEDADDIRLNAKLFKACRSDQKKFCSDVAPGANRMKDCLEEHRDDADFSSECKQEFEAMMVLRAADFRLDSSLRDACARDIEETCGYKADADEAVERYDARVIACLQDFRGDLKERACRDAVAKVMARASQDIRFDEPLADACFADRDQLCAGYMPGSARVIRCLQDNRKNLSYSCRASLFDHEVRLAEDIDFQYPLKKACTSELKSLCGKVQQGHARLVRCLQRNVDDRGMGRECKREVRRSMNLMAQDYRLNFRLNKACHDDIEATCKQVCDTPQSCGGTVLRCLQENMDKLQSVDCKDEVFYFVKMEVSDFRNDVMLAEACKPDVETHCAEVKPGEGRVLECLRMHRASLSEGCRNEELTLSQLQAQDVRLRPRLMKVCSEEIVVFCKDVKPGGGRMFTCLLENAQKPNFNALCRAEVVKREDRIKSDYRLDAGVHKDCAPDIDTHCAAEKAAAHGHAEVLRCLADKMVDRSVTVADACETQMSRAVRMAFWDYKANSSLTVACDADVARICPETNKNRGVYTIGVIGRCLTKQLASGAPLSAGCRKLVSVAAPKDIRLYLQDTMNKDGTLKVGYFKAVIDRAANATSFITLSGWVAVASIAASVFLAIFGSIWLYKRFAGLEKPYTQFVPKSAAEKVPLNSDK